MTQINEVSRSQISGISHIVTDGETYLVRNEDLVIGNKIVKARKHSKLKTISIYKDLFLRTCERDLYISLTDTNGFNKKIKEIEHNDLYLLTDGTALTFKSRDMGRFGVVNLENLIGYGFEDEHFDYNKAIRLLKIMNKYIQRKVTANMIQHYGGSLKTTKSGIVVFHDDNFDDVNDSITTDLSTGIMLTKKFEK